MNSEELEQSLRVEFETYLKGVLVNLHNDVTEFHKTIDLEIEKHRSLMNDEFQRFSERFQKMPDFEGGFRESVLEHLRLARDEGAKITATAIAQAEELEKATSPVVDLSEIRDAINDISSKDSQSSILKTLIQHAARYTPRGAFFIIKNEHFVGWRVFGKESSEGDMAIREVHFPVSADSILGGAVRSLATVEASFGAYAADPVFLDPLHFGQPDRMYAIPLVARGRGVAVLYCDYGHEGVMVNTDALEMLVKVAGLTVELLASAKPGKSDSHGDVSHELSASYYDIEEARPTGSVESAPQIGVIDHLVPAEAAEPEVIEPFATPIGGPRESGSTISITPIDTGEPVEPFARPASETPAAEYDFKSQFDMAPEYVPGSPTPPIEPSPSFENAEFETTHSFTAAPDTSSVPIDEKVLSDELSSYDPFERPKNEFVPLAGNEPQIVFDTATPKPIESFDSTPAEPVPVFEPTPKFEQPQYQEAAGFEPNRFDSSPAVAEPAASQFGGPAPVLMPVVETVAAKPAGGRLSDRHVDLPIEVAEDERRLHNDARRFARLLVSEIKLYNEKRVQEGRESHDLYERLREAIDRSREMYDKRVQPPVASKFDYFHYELVNSLAEGDESRLGTSYKGAII